MSEKTGAEWMTLDVDDKVGLKEALSKVDTVFNAVGPYHLHGLKVVEAAIETGTHYVDMSDDHEPAEELFFNPGLGPEGKGRGHRRADGMRDHAGVKWGAGSIRLRQYGRSPSGEYLVFVELFVELPGGNTALSGG